MIAGSCFYAVCTCDSGFRFAQELVRTETAEKIMRIKNGISGDGRRFRVGSVAPPKQFMGSVPDYLLHRNPSYFAPLFVLLERENGCTKGKIKICCDHIDQAAAGWQKATEPQYICYRCSIRL